MDDADQPSAALGGEPGVLGSLPTTRPQHRSARRASTAPRSANGAGTTRSARAAAPSRPVSLRAVTAPDEAPRDAVRAAAGSPPARPAPDVPAPPPAPRSGWATPEPQRAPSTPQPPLVALADGAVRTGAQLLRGVLRRLPRG